MTLNRYNGVIELPCEMDDKPERRDDPDGQWLLVPDDYDCPHCDCYFDGEPCCDCGDVE